MMLMLVVVCSCFGFAFQPVGQKYVPAETAAVFTVVNPLTASILGITIDRDLMLVYDDEETVRSMEPDMEKVKQLDGLLLHVTAPGKDYDCVSRSFAPKCDVVEDPVCGSGHCHIIPYWSKRLEKADIKAFQASKRTGVLYGHCEQDSMIISGHAALFAKGEAANEDGSF